MAVNRWSLDRLIAWIGTAALLALFVPMGLYLVHNVSTSVEQYLSERGRSLGRTLAGQIVEPMLLEDRLALHDALRKAAASDSEVRYITLEDAAGGVLAHTFARGLPRSLPKLWALHRGQTLRFRTGEEELLDISMPLLDGQLGNLHVGMSRRRATRAANRLTWWIGAALVAALSVVLRGHPGAEGPRHAGGGVPGQGLRGHGPAAGGPPAGPAGDPAADGPVRAPGGAG